MADNPYLGLDQKELDDRLFATIRSTDDIEKADLLIEAGANVDAQRYWSSMLDNAVMLGQLKHAQNLIENHGVQPVGHEDDLHVLAVQSGVVEMAKYVEGYTVNAQYIQQETGQTLAHWAARSMDPDMIDYVESIGVDIDERTFSGDTVAHEALNAFLSFHQPIPEDAIAMLNHLREKGIDLNAVNDNGDRIFDRLSNLFRGGASPTMRALIQDVGDYLESVGAGREPVYTSEHSDLSERPELQERLEEFNDITGQNWQYYQSEVSEYIYLPVQANTQEAQKISRGLERFDEFAIMQGPSIIPDRGNVIAIGVDGFLNSSRESFLNAADSISRIMSDAGRNEVKAPDVSLENAHDSGVASVMISRQ